MATSQGLICPICLNVYFKPINLPCGHILCEVCLERSLDEATLGCPICRHRLSSWRRHVTSLSACINKELEDKIRCLFPIYYSNKENGLETTLCESEAEVLRNVSNDPIPPVQLAAPGSIRAEYEEAIAKASELSVQEEADLAMSRYMLLESLDSIDDNDENISTVESSSMHHDHQNDILSDVQMNAVHQTSLRHNSKECTRKPVIKTSSRSLLKTRRNNLAPLKSCRSRSKSSLACSRILNKRLSAKQCNPDLATFFK